MAYKAGAGCGKMFIGVDNEVSAGMRYCLHMNVSGTHVNHPVVCLDPHAWC